MESKSIYIMAITPGKPKRAFNTKASVLLVSADTITQSASERQQAFADADTLYTPLYFSGLATRINNASREILGVDTAFALRSSTDILHADHVAALNQLSLVKIFLDSKYTDQKDRREELLNHLGFKSFFTEAAKGRQEAMGHLLHRISESLTADLKAEFMSKGMPEARFRVLQSLAATYMNNNSDQEGFKDNRKELSAQNVTELNGIYHEIIAICSYGQRLFTDLPAIQDRFVFDKVSARQSAYTNTPSVDPESDQPKISS